MSAADPRERDLVKCEDMRIHAVRARQFMGKLTLEDFCRDDMVQAAVVRCIEVIGEAARLVSDATRSRAPQIQWPLIIGIRNVLAHDYGTVELDKVYEVVAQHLPSLLTSLQGLIRELEKEVGWDD